MGTDRRLLAGLILVVLSSCRSSSQTHDASGIVRSKDNPDQTMEQLHLQSYGPQGLEWELQAPAGEAFSADGRTILKNLSVNLYSNSKKSTTVKAEQGIMYAGASGSEGAALTLSTYSVTLEPGDMFLTGHVVLVSTDGNRLETDWAHYKKKLELIVSTAPVKVVREDSTTKGFGMEATADLSNIKIFNETLVIPGTPKKGVN